MTTTLETKITVKVYRPLIEDFNVRVDALLLRRDAFLNATIAREVPRLARDLEGKVNTKAANRYIAGELKRLGTIPVNMVVDKTTAEALNQVVKQHNLVRDAFINRLLLMLRGGHQLLTRLNLAEFVNGSEFQWSCVEPMQTSPLKALEDVHKDPLLYLRESCEERHKVGLYLLDFPQRLAGFTCYLDNALVPGTAEHATSRQELELFLDQLGTLEREAFEI